MYDNLNNYKIFYIVATLGNLSRASEVLYISQPAISKAIHNLETGLNARLFNRNSKGVILTEEGEILFSHISKAFENINQGEDEIKKFNDLDMGQLRIGVSTSLCKHILLDSLQQFIKKYPHIKVIIDCHSTLNTMKLLSDAQIDIGLICETDIPKGFIYKPITDIHDTFVISSTYLDNLLLRENEEKEIPKNNPWLFSGNLTSFLNTESNDSIITNYTSFNEKMSIKTILEKSNLMLLEKNNITRKHIDNYLNNEHIMPKQILEINNMDLLIDFASIGMGVSSVVREFAIDAINAGQIIELPLDNPIPKRTVGFIYSDKNIKSKALNKFIDFCNI